MDCFYRHLFLTYCFVNIVTVNEKKITQVEANVRCNAFEMHERAGSKWMKTCRTTYSERHDQVERVCSERRETLRISSSARFRLLTSSAFASFQTRSGLRSCISNALHLTFASTWATPSFVFCSHWLIELAN